MAGATLVAVTTENASSVTVDNDKFEIADGNLKLKDDMSLDFEEAEGGTVSVTITASGDGESATHTVTVTINDLNEAPTIDVADGETPDGMPASSTVDEANAGAILGAITLSDPDAGQTHTLTVTGDDRVVTKQDDAGGWWLALADGESFDFETDGDTIMVTVTVTDSGDPAMSASADVTITVNNVNEPAAVNGEVPDMAFVGGQENSMEVDLMALFSDADGDTLTYSLSDNAPDWLTLSVTTSGSGDDQTITATISGTPPVGDITVDDVAIIATDPGGMEAHAMFDVVVDEENDAPTVLELRVTDDEGVTTRVTTAEIDENVTGDMPKGVLGKLVLRDPDDARHPHGQHEYTFTVGGEADDRFEVTDDGMLKLKDDASLNYEAGATVVLTVTATDMMVGELGEGEDPTTASKSLVITITVGNVDEGTSEGPALVEDAKVGPVTITVDEDLEEDDVDAGEWLKTVPKGLSTAFEDPDGDTLTYSLGSGAPAWLKINEKTGELTNKALMLPRRDVYDVTITATDDDGNPASVEIKIAVAIGDLDDSDNDEPDIRNIDEYDYEENSGGGKVVSFEVRDEDIEIAPHPYGVLKVTFTANQDNGSADGLDVTHAFKIVPMGNDGRDTAEYEIHAKTTAELAEGADRDGDDEIDVDDDGDVIPVKPIDYENGRDIDFTLMVTDSAGDPGDDIQDASCPSRGR